ncbi:MAG: phosphate ABC transporter permease PstA [Pseudomonadota bacterium]
MSNISEADSLTRGIDPKRHRSERIFRYFGIAAIVLSLGFLVVMVSSIVLRGTGAFQTTFVQIEIDLPEDKIDPEGTRNPEELAFVRYGSILKGALRERFPEASTRSERRELYRLVSATAEYTVRDQVAANPELIGTRAKFWIRSSSDVDMFVKGNIDASLEESQRRISDQQIAWIESLRREGALESRFNTQFFTSGDSREPEQAGIWGAVVGSFYSLLVCFILSFPLGVLAAVYLEEFAVKNRLSRIIEVNINNLAAVPSIVFGLLGLAIFLNFFDLPRSSPLVGGMVLALMTLPTIIIASRASLRAVPPSVREAALGLGASRVQTTFHHVVPLAMPGMLTGTIIGMAQALGETAPLLMIGMVAFIVDVPSGITDAATALPVQIFLWADSPERGFLEKTSAAIMVLLGFLVVMNLLAIVLRRRLEVRW